MWHVSESKVFWYGPQLEAIWHTPEADVIYLTRVRISSHLARARITNDIKKEARIASRLRREDYKPASLWKCETAPSNKG